MTSSVQAKPAVPGPASTPQEARDLAEHLLEDMTALLAVIDRETELVRAGLVAEAIRLEETKSQLSRRYQSGIARLKASQAYLVEVAPDLLSALHRHHDMFRAMLQVNLTVLATAHAVSEGIVRGVNLEIQKRNSPQTYTARGLRSAPVSRHIVPLSVSRTM